MLISILRAAVAHSTTPGLWNTFSLLFWRRKLPGCVYVKQGRDGGNFSW